MKSFFLLMSVLLFSCAKAPVPIKNEGQKILNYKHDVLRKEAMLRYGEGRLNVEFKKKNNSLVGAAHCHQGDISDGLKLLKEYYHVNKKSPVYWNQVATCYYLKGDFPKASLYYKFAINVAKDMRLKYAPAHNNLGVMYLKEKNYNLAKAQFQKAMSANQKLLTPKFNYGQLQLKFGYVDEALEQFQYLYRFNRNDIDVLSAMGSIFLMKGNPKVAIAYYKKVPKEHLKRQDIATNYAIALSLTNQNKKAIDVIDDSNVHNEDYYRDYSSAVAEVLEKRVN